MATSGERIAEHRRRAARRGLRRIEVTVPAKDAELVRGLAAALRRGDPAATVLREQLAAGVGRGRAESGADLVAFFRNSPLVGVDLQFERDRFGGRPVDVED